MKLIRSVILGLPALAVALGASTGAANAATATRTAHNSPARPAITGPTWNALKLANGWQPKIPIATPGTGSPSWTVSNGIVYLSGGIHQPAGTSPAAARLAAAARPAKTQLVEVVMGGGPGFVKITPDGWITVGVQHPSQYPNAQLGVSLSGVSFPAAATIRHSFTVGNGWTAVAAEGSPAYTISGGMVHLSGALTRTGIGGATFATLPSSAWPAYSQYIQVYTDGGVTGEIIVTSHGKISAIWGHSTTLTSLAAATFPLASTTLHPLTLIGASGWVAGLGFGTGGPAFAKVGSLVCLSGSMTRGITGTQNFATLPASIRPVHAQYLTADTQNGAGGALEIPHSGAAFAAAFPTSWGHQFTSLASACYMVNA